MKKFSKILVGLLVVVCIVEGFFLYRAYAIPSTGIITVVKPVKGSPADGSGLKKGDILTKVGNYKLKTSDALDDIVKKIKGAEGTKVKLTFTRNQTSKTYTFTRQSIETPTVETKMLQDKVGYLQITEFDEVTVSQFRSGLKSLKKQGAKKLILHDRFFQKERMFIPKIRMAIRNITKTQRMNSLICRYAC